jgi:hypothetical protein
MKASIGFARELKQHPIAADDLGARFAWLEGRSEVLLDWFDAVAGHWHDTGRWHEGRIFGPESEYRWRCDAKGDIHAVIIRDEATLPDGFGGRLPLVRDGADAAQILWGEWVVPIPESGENPEGRALFYANEIPSIQTYPLAYDQMLLQKAAEKKRTPRMLVRRYRVEPEALSQNTAEAIDETGSAILQRRFVRCLGFDLRNEGEEY